ncbi:dCTP deaminase/dUTPase family protein [Pectinatus haikarae]|uniref:dUTP diphosphatase n=1 Tax=Pectinatus haikarae TaxID=349096 RepID=A0ABT9Y585_9FIRM|nr:dUTP diphosphatase [Pectinatus haikarae]MDQ0202347.1 dUTP pyrophosphatase [Pectinatus haikarae]
MKNRGFEIVSVYEGNNIILPERKTDKSAGYDIACAEDAILKAGKVTLIPTGLKAYMNDDEYLGIHIRSSIALKNSLSFINGQGIIDADYYNNANNEGHIMLAVFNHASTDFSVKKGTRLAQGIFYKYLMTDGDSNDKGLVRHGGMGSTGV